MLGLRLFGSSRRKIIYALLMILSFLLLEATINFFIKYGYEFRKNQYINSSVNEEQENFDSVINYYKAASDTIVLNLKANPEFTNTLKNANNTSDLKRINGIFINKYQEIHKLNSSYGLSMFNIYDAKGNFLVRFQKPELYGGNALGFKKIILKAYESKQSVYGFESGQYYNAYRYVYPIMENEKLLGIIELAFDESAISKALGKFFGTATYFAIYDKKNLSSDKNATPSYIQDNGNNFIHNAGSYSKEQLRLVEDFFGNNAEKATKAAKEKKHFAIDGISNGVHYLVVCNPLYDFAGNFAGYLVMYHKDALLATLKQQYYVLTAIGSMAVFVVWIGLIVLLLNYAKTRAELSNNKIEQSVLLENLAEGVFSVDTEGKCVFINDRALDILGYTQSEIVGKHMHELIHYHKRDGAHFSQEDCPLYKSLSTGLASDGEDWFIKKGGAGFHVYFSVAPIYFDGVRSGAVTIFLDITERKLAEENLVELNKTLEAKVNEEVAKNREKDYILQRQSRLAAMGEMIGNIAHQWRQPLNALGVAVQDVQQAFNYGELNEEYVKNFKNESMELIRHMSKTIDDFRSFFSPDRQKVTFCINDSIIKAYSLEKDFLESNMISVEMALPNEHIDAFGFPNEFSQVLLNIMNNAKDALLHKKETNRVITIKMHRENESIKILIEDNAGGIPEDIIDKIFDPYFTTKHKSQGTGLGLYMSKMIIEQNMDGKLNAYNTLSGACFEIELHEKPLSENMDPA